MNDIEIEVNQAELVQLYNFALLCHFFFGKTLRALCLDALLYLLGRGFFKQKCFKIGDVVIDEDNLTGSSARENWAAPAHSSTSFLLV